MNRPYNPPFTATDQKQRALLPKLARLFRPQYAIPLATGEAEVFQEYRSIMSSAFFIATPSLLELYERAYSILFWNYRVEYVYKNALFNKVVLSKNTRTVIPFLTELRVGKHAIDILLPNSGAGIEIKSPLDTLKRVNGQIGTFSRATRFLSVVCDQAFVPLFLSLLPPSVGITVLTNRYQFRTIRKSSATETSIDRSLIFDTLRASEYREVTDLELGRIPNTNRYNVVREQFIKLSTDEAYRRFTNAISKRTLPVRTNTLKLLPHSLRLMVYEARLTNDRICQISDNVQRAF